MGWGEKKDRVCARGENRGRRFDGVASERNILEGILPSFAYVPLISIASGLCQRGSRPIIIAPLEDFENFRNETRGKKGEGGEGGREEKNLN